MLRINTVLAADDFSATSQYAVGLAMDMADHFDARLVHLFARILYEDAEAGTAEPLAPSREAVLANLNDGLKSRIQRTDRAEIATVRDIAPAPAILQYAADHDVDLIVMGTHGRRGLRRLFLGSVAEEVVRLSRCPVLTVRLPTGEFAPTGPVVVPIDFSDHSKTAIRYGREMAAFMKTSVTLVHVVEETLHPAFYNTGVFSIYDVQPGIEDEARAQLESCFDKAGGPAVDRNIRVLPGHAASDTVRVAEEIGARMIVTATHGLTGLKHFSMGSVAERIVRRAPCPVLSVKSFGKSLLDA